MFDGVPDGTDGSAGELLAGYAEGLHAMIEAHGGIEAVATETDVDTAAIAAIADGRLDEVTLTDGAAILALEDDRDAATIAAEAREGLLLGMANAVLDVDTLARALDCGLDPREVQQKIEGRHPMTIDEYARIRSAVARRSP